jgi:soluble lytic murein transglycosylase-like protein
MAGDNLRIQNPIVPLVTRNDEKFTSKTRSQKSFEIGKRDFPVARREDYSKNETDDFRPALTEENWLRERTLEELKTLVKAVQLGATDPWALTDMIFYARHPEMKGMPLTAEHQELLDEWNSISALLVHPTLNEIKDVIGADELNGLVNDKNDLNNAFAAASRFKINVGNLDDYTTRYDNIIANSVEWCPGLSPAVLKSLLAQESKFHPTVINQYGYAGIAQFGRVAAREVGLNVGVAGSASDERLDPSKAIPGAARLLNIKAQRLGEIAFSRYGQPDGVEFWKFVTAAYNGGEGTVALAMGNAYRIGLSEARAKGLVGTEAVSFARRYASKWENLKTGGTSSPLGLAAARFFPTIAAQKYQEIGNYPTQIMARVAGTFK